MPRGWVLVGLLLVAACGPSGIPYQVVKIAEVSECKSRNISWIAAARGVNVGFQLLARETEIWLLADVTLSYGKTFRYAGNDLKLEVLPTGPIYVGPLAGFTEARTIPDGSGKKSSGFFETVRYAPGEGLTGWGDPLGKSAPQQFSSITVLPIQPSAHVRLHLPALELDHQAYMAPTLEFSLSEQRC